MFLKTQVIVNPEEEERFFINVADFRLGGEVVKKG